MDAQVQVAVELREHLLPHGVALLHHPPGEEFRAAGEAALRRRRVHDTTDHRLPEADSDAVDGMAFGHGRCPL